MQCWLRAVKTCKWFQREAKAFNFNKKWMCGKIKPRTILDYRENFIYLNKSYDINTLKELNRT